jgi:hypothetical protein
MYNPRFLFAPLLLLFIVFATKAQQQAPLLSGKVTINMKQGLIIADLQLSGLPTLDTGFRIRLNRGMNMKLIRDSAGVVRYNNRPGDEFNTYRIHNGKSYIPLSKTLKVAYSGAFPVYTDTLTFSDSKGVIAFNGKTMRASEQSKWYPVVYDTRSDHELAELRYDITVDCNDCKMIYLNGSEAQVGPVQRFTSNTPYELLLFTGDYQKQAFSGSDFLNANMPDQVAKAFNAQIVGIKSFYQSKLGIPYQQKITFVQHKAIEPYGPNRSWGFVTFPSIAVAGGQFNNQIDPKTGKFNHIVKYSFYAHELGHYYFGSILSPNSTLRWFFLESMAEYLSVKAAEKEYGKDSTLSYIRFAKKLLGDKKIIPLSKVTNTEQIDELYRYSYGPVLLLALEKRVGEDKVYRMLQHALKRNGEKTDYAFFTSIAIESGISIKQWQDFEKEVILLEKADLLFNQLLPTKN